MFFFINYFSDLIFKLTDNYNYALELGSGSGLRSVVGSNKTKFISCEINKYGRLVQKKISKKLNKNTLEIEFDFNKILEKNKDNPVFYVQYCYARINSIFKTLNISPNKKINYNFTLFKALFLNKLASLIYLLTI